MRKHVNVLAQTNLQKRNHLENRQNFENSKLQLHFNTFYFNVMYFNET